MVRLLRCAGLAGLLAALTGCPRPAPPPSSATPRPATPPALPTPSPPPYVPNKRLETGRIFNGLQYRATLETEFGTTASSDRNDPSSYVAELTVRVKVPKPHNSLEEISKLNGRLPELLPQLPALLEAASVSPFFDDLYRLKVSSLRTSLNRLDQFPTRHNFYDTETILELQHPETKRRVLLIQSEMDVDSDGSDSDRASEGENSSLTFQPFTSYRWPKKTDKPNPFIAPREAKIRQLETGLAASPSAARSAEIKKAVADLKDEIGDLKKFSFLVGALDPFVVLPLSMFGRGKGPFGPSIGDYCVVIHEGVLCPAIVGDAGPANKLGEASTRICKQLNEKSSPMYRPVSDLKVTYLVFPGTVDKPFDAPDLAKWRQRCDVLLSELGGYQGELLTWEDLTRPKPPAALPSATPAPAATPPPTSPGNDQGPKPQDQGIPN